MAPPEVPNLAPDTSSRQCHSQSLIPGLPVLGSPQMPTRTAVLLPGARRALTYVPRALGIQQSVLTSALLQGPGLSLTLAED